MRISRLTIDKLGVKLYDSVSAVVSELIANAYDADAEVVRVRVPLNTALTRRKGDAVDDLGLVIEAIDNGHGMTPDEACDFYLQVGQDRRRTKGQGGRSRRKRRSVMGRKGIGKLAPFGICRRIEILSAGGPRTAKGYLTTHFSMDFDKILSPTDVPVTFDPGARDRTYSRTAGTTITLANFLPKRVPDAETFHRQLARRFLLGQPDFKILVEDLRETVAEPAQEVSSLSIPLIEGTRIDLGSRPVPNGDDELPVSGWLGLAKTAYKNEEMTGVRIYARGKLVGSTRDFEQPAGFTGEFTIRSYLVGEVTAEWLDLDEGEDLVRTDRQNILWDSEYGQAFRLWGASLIREIAAASRKPRRIRAKTLFLEASKIEERAKKRFQDKEVVAAAVDLAERIGAFAAEDELTDQVYVDELSDVILTVAPHQALIQSFQDFASSYSGTPPTLDSLLDLFSKTRVAEMASYSQIAAERVRVLRQLERLVTVDTDEDKLQQLIAEAPWLIEPSWSVLTKNQSLKSFKTAFEKFWKARTGQTVALAIGAGQEKKRPDFTLVAVGHHIHLVEIKASGHTFDDKDFDRLVNYPEALEDFFKQHTEIATEFPLGYRIDLIADGAMLKKPANRQAFEALVKAEKLRRLPWTDFLHHAKKTHEMFVTISDEASKRAKP